MSSTPLTQALVQFVGLEAALTLAAGVYLSCAPLWETGGAPADDGALVLGWALLWLAVCQAAVQRGVHGRGSARTWWFVAMVISGVQKILALSNGSASALHPMPRATLWLQYAFVVTRLLCLAQWHCVAFDGGDGDEMRGEDNAPSALADDSLTNYLLRIASMDRTAPRVLLRQCASPSRVVVVGGSAAEESSLASSHAMQTRVSRIPTAAAAASPNRRAAPANPTRSGGVARRGAVRRSRIVSSSRRSARGGKGRARESSSDSDSDSGSDSDSSSGSESDAGEFRCEGCGRMFTSESRWRSHALYCIGDDPVRQFFPCRRCTRVCTSAAARNEHSRVCKGRGAAGGAERRGSATKRRASLAATMSPRAKRLRSRAR